jgi:hypothetical protein
MVRSPLTLRLAAGLRLLRASMHVWGIRLALRQSNNVGLGRAGYRPQATGHRLQATGLNRAANVVYNSCGL